MKTVKLRSLGPYATKAIIKDIVSNAPPGGINLAQMRSRVRILDVLEKAEDTELKLEDADHQALVDVFNLASWSKADRDLLQIVDDVISAS